MDWIKTEEAVEEAVDHFLIGSPSARFSQVEAAYAKVPSLSKKQEPITFAFAAYPSAYRDDGNSSLPSEGRLKVYVQREKGDPTTPQITKTILGPYFEEKGIPSHDYEVISSGRFKCLALAPNFGVAENLKQLMTPPRPGIRIATDGGQSGAIACFAQTPADKGNNNGQIFALTARHIATDGETKRAGSWVYQPSNKVGGYQLGKTSSKKANLTGWIDVPDAAAIQINTNDVRFTDLHGAPRNFKLTRPTMLEAFENQEVGKLGPETGLTIGRITSPAAGLRVFLSEDSSVLIKRGFLAESAGYAFAKKGDSGSPVFLAENGSFVGMVIAGMSRNGKTTVASMLTIDVLNSLGLEFVE
ncbi:MAG: hypothetical protein AAF768_04075 [Pseudomonadota bacterium]